MTTSCRRKQHIFVHIYLKKVATNTLSTQLISKTTLIVQFQSNFHYSFTLPTVIYSVQHCAEESPAPASFPTLSWLMGELLLLLAFSELGFMLSIRTSPTQLGSPTSYLKRFRRFFQISAYRPTTSTAFPDWLIRASKTHSARRLLK